MYCLLSSLLGTACSWSLAAGWHLFILSSLGASHIVLQGLSAVPLPQYVNKPEDKHNTIKTPVIRPPGKLQVILQLVESAQQTTHFSVYSKKTTLAPKTSTFTFNEETCLVGLHWCSICCYCHLPRIPSVIAFVHNCNPKNIDSSLICLKKKRQYPGISKSFTIIYSTSQRPSKWF